MSDTNKNLPKFVECGCCGQYHPSDYYGECRDDKYRFNWEQLDERYGIDGWEEVFEDLDDKPNET